MLECLNMTHPHSASEEGAVSHRGDTHAALTHGQTLASTRFDDVILLCVMLLYHMVWARVYIMS